MFITRLSFLIVSFALAFLILSCSKKPEVLISEQDSLSGFIKLKEMSLSDSHIPKDIKEFKELIEKSSENGLDVNEADTINTKAQQLREILLRELDKIISNLAEESVDSQEYKNWKAEYKSCLTDIKIDIEENWSPEKTEENLPIKHKQTVERIEGCHSTAQKNKSNITNEKEREDADKQLKDSQVIIGALLMVVGAVMMYFGVTYGYEVFLIGLSMIAGTQSESSGGDGEQVGSGQSSEQQPESENKSRNLPDELVQKGFKSFGNTNESGNYTFLYNEEMRLWAIADIKSGFKFIIESKFSDTSDLESIVISEDNLFACDMSLEKNGDGLEITMKGHDPCPNFKIIPKESKWVAVRTDPLEVREIE